MSRGLVTGAAGFVGAHLVDRLLAGGHEVIGVDAFTGYYSRRTRERNLEDASGNAGLRLVEGNLLDLDVLLDGVESVAHLAGEPGVRRSWGPNFPRYVTRNLLTTERLLEAAGRKGGTRLVCRAEGVLGYRPRIGPEEGVAARAEWAARTLVAAPA